jgi:hypothetical protein
VGKKGIVAVVVMGALLALISGCGSGKEAAETSAALSKAAFAKQASQVCEETKDRFVENFAQVRKLADEPKAREDFEYKLVKTTIAPALEDEVEQLRSLGAPAGSAAEVDQMLKLIEGAVAEAETEPETYVAGDDYKWGSEHFGKAHRLALALGAGSCPAGEE